MYFLQDFRDGRDYLYERTQERLGLQIAGKDENPKLFWPNPLKNRSARKPLTIRDALTVFRQSERASNTDQYVGRLHDRADLVASLQSERMHALLGD